MPKPRLIRRESSDARAATSAVWPVMQALGVADPQREVVLSESYTVTGKQIQEAATVADKLVRTEENRAYRAEEQLAVVSEQRDRALILLRRIGDLHYDGRYLDARTALEAANALAGEVGVLDLDRDVRTALAGVLADGPALDVAVAAALNAAVTAPAPAGSMVGQQTVRIS